MEVSSIWMQRTVTLARVSGKIRAKTTLLITKSSVVSEEKVSTINEGIEVFEIGHLAARY
jgi:hypothetical protein